MCHTTVMWKYCLTKLVILQDLRWTCTQVLSDCCEYFPKSKHIHDGSCSFEVLVQLVLQGALTGQIRLTQFLRDGQLNQIEHVPSLETTHSQNFQLKNPYLLQHNVKWIRRLINVPMFVHLPWHKGHKKVTLMAGQQLLQLLFIFNSHQQMRRALWCYLYKFRKPCVTHCTITL